ncbi:MAG: OmpA family protein [Polyangiaceae bacterium]
MTQSTQWTYAGWISVIALVAAIGCSKHHQEPVMTPASGARTETRTSTDTQSGARASDAQSSQSRGYLWLNSGLRERCNLPDSPAESPQFDFDQEALRDRGKGILDQVANCMSNGSLKDSKIVIIGHADPRGTEAYNYGLGLRRAESARDYLVGKGISQDRITTRSRGETDAKGDTEASLQQSRRVEIEEASGTSQ